MKTRIRNALIVTAVFALSAMGYVAAYTSAAKQVCATSRDITVGGQRLRVFAMRPLYSAKARVFFAPIHALDRRYLRPARWTIVVPQHDNAA